MASTGRMSAPRAFPLLTASVTAVTAVVSVTGLLVEPVLLALRRDPVALAAGQPWRLVTALLVQDGGVPGTVLNLLGLALVGLAAERRLGRTGWSLAYLAGGLTGELVGWAGWQPIGAGNSVGVCGLAGALAVALLRTSDPPGRLAAVAPATWAAALTAGTLTALAPTLAAVVTGAAVARGSGPARVLPTVLVAAAAVFLLVRLDIHGAALATGLLVGAAVRSPDGER
jgi:membrane associated rhomboid family serine protease